MLICYGAVDAIGSIACGSIVKYVGRLAISIVAAALNLGLIITLLLWRPNPSESIVFYIIAALWGLSDAMWHIQLNCKSFDIKCSFMISLPYSPNTISKFYI